MPMSDKKKREIKATVATVCYSIADGIGAVQDWFYTVGNAMDVDEEGPKSVREERAGSK